jgi:hypothetical protein
MALFESMRAGTKQRHSLVAICTTTPTIPTTLLPLQNAAHYRPSIPEAIAILALSGLDLIVHLYCNSLSAINC